MVVVLRHTTEMKEKQQFFLLCFLLCQKNIRQLQQKSFFSALHPICGSGRAL